MMIMTLAQPHISFKTEGKYWWVMRYPVPWRTFSLSRLLLPAHLALSFTHTPLLVLQLSWGLRCPWCTGGWGHFLSFPTLECSQMVSLLHGNELIRLLFREGRREIGHFCIIPLPNGQLGLPSRPEITTLANVRPAATLKHTSKIERQLLWQLRNSFTLYESCM